VGRAAPAVLIALALAGCGGGDDEPSAAGVLSVEQALEVESDEPVAVRGSLVVDAAGEMRLCSALAESYPPQCGGASLAVEGLPAHELPPLERAQGVAWSDEPVLLHGFVVEEALRVLGQPG
jgi:hypothetical protein